MAVAAATDCATAFGGAVALGAKAEAAKPQDVLPALSTPEPANPDARVSDSGEKPPRVDVAGPRSSGQRPWGARGYSTDGMPKSVNNKVLATGSRDYDSDSGVAVHCLGDSTSRPMAKADEDRLGSLFSSDYERDLEEEVEERREVAGQVEGFKPELPLAPPSSARVGSGTEANGNAKAKGKAQVKAKRQSRGQGQGQGRGAGRGFD